MTIDEIKKLMKQFDESSLTELKYEAEGIGLTLKKSGDPHPVYTQPIMVHPQAMPMTAAPGIAPGSAPAPAAAAAGNTAPAPGGDSTAAAAAGATDIEVITSPLVGTFYRSPSPDSPPFCQEGTIVNKGDTICILEAMKVMNELEAEFTMEIVSFKAHNGDMIEYGTPIVEVRRV